MPVNEPCGVGLKRKASGCSRNVPSPWLRNSSGPERAEHDQILMAGVAEIGEQRAGGFVQNAEAGALGDVFGGAIGPDLVEAVGQAAGLADIDLVDAVVVDIADGDSLVAVDVDARGGIEARAPVGIAIQQLLLEGRGGAENVGGDVAEEGARGDYGLTGDGFEAGQLPEAVVIVEAFGVGDLDLIPDLIAGENVEARGPDVLALCDPGPQGGGRGFEAGEDSGEAGLHIGGGFLGGEFVRAGFDKAQGRVIGVGAGVMNGKGGGLSGTGRQ